MMTSKLRKIALVLSTLALAAAGAVAFKKQSRVPAASLDGAMTEADFGELGEVPTDTALRDWVDDLGGTLNINLRTLFNPEKGTVLAIPDGRSLQKNKSDFKDPRIIYIHGTQLFMGYAARANQVEVLSMNKNSGTMDTFLIKNYGPGLTPKIFRADKNLCFSCHQNSGAIFPRGPWTESTISHGITQEEIDGSEYLKTAKVEPSPGNDLYVALLAANGGKTDFYGIDIKKDISVTTPSAFDGTVRSNAKVLQMNKVCHTVCQDNVSFCHGLLLRAAFSELSFFEELLLNAQIQKNWPQDEFAYPSTVLPDRDPLRNKEQGGVSFDVVIENETAYREALSVQHKVNVSHGQSDGSVTQSTEMLFPLGDPKDPQSSASRNLRLIEFAKKQALIDPRWRHPRGIDVTYTEEGTSQNITFFEAEESEKNDKNERVAFGTAYLLPTPTGPNSRAEPLTPRPLVGHIPRSEANKFILDIAESCLFTTEQSKLFNGTEIHPDELKKAFSKLKVSDYKQDWPKKRVDFLRDLFRQADREDLVEKLAAGRKISIVKETSNSPSNNSNAEIKTPLFVTYCQKCHTDDTIRQFPLRDMTTLNKTDAAELHDELCAKEMPPQAEPQPDDQTRDTMARQLTGEPCSK